MKKCLVTGANGFLGNALTKRLAELQINVLAIVKNKEGLVDSNYIKYIEFDLDNVKKLHEAVSDRDIDCCFHFAWNGSAGPLRADYYHQLKNVENSCDLISELKRINCSKIVFAASIMEFECLQSLESGIIPGTNNIYSAAKLTSHIMCEMLSKEIGVDFYPVVISNIYGEGEVSPRLINSTIKIILDGKTPGFTDGKQMYDFIYIRDAVDAFIAIAEKGQPFKNYYLGSLCPKPLKEYLLEMSECFEPSAKINLGAIPFNGISVDYYKTFDIFAVKNDTGFEPKYSFKQGIINTIDWIKNYEG